MLVLLFLIAGWGTFERFTFNNAAPFLAMFILLVWRIAYASQHGVNALNRTWIKFLFLMMFVGSGLIGLAHNNEAKDIFRDLGSIASFVLFLLYTQSLYTNEWAGRRIFWSIIVLCALISVAAIIFAAWAAAAGADSYVWRGEYVPTAAEWIIYGWSAALLLFLRDSSFPWTLKWYFLLMMAGIFASLSRTNILLAIVLYLLISIVDAIDRRKYLKIAQTFAVLAVLAAGAYFALADVPVFNERITATTEADQDQSIGWRLLEHEAFFDDLERWSPVELAFGRGLGYRLPLPPGVLDFDGRPSIPYLHDSYATIFMKFGGCGLLFVIFSICYCMFHGWKRHKREKALSPAVGALFLLVVAAKAVTLQGLSSYQNLMFAGVSVALVVQGHRDRFVDLVAKEAS
ncbi:MAG: hypothetical protein E6R07_08735 [Nevskiaceae bacterium]|nr:MAG: hypothetical protein E6R07_08735 [Nevskiaceae bacterium]